MDILKYDKLNDLISERLSELNPFKVILFGSHARGTAGENSDIDLLVVLNIEGCPRSFKERMENHRKVRRLLKDINARVSMDVLVFTIDEWSKFLEDGSSFASEVLENGKAIA